MSLFPTAFLVKAQFFSYVGTLGATNRGLLGWPATYFACLLAILEPLFVLLSRHSCNLSRQLCAVGHSSTGWYYSLADLVPAIRANESWGIELIPFPKSYGNGHMGVFQVL